VNVFYVKVTIIMALNHSQLNSAQFDIKFIFRALSSRNYRLFFSGQIISLVGTWMQQLAMSWLVYRLTGSSLLLGVTAFLGQIPTLFLTPFAGVISDRYNRHHILIMAQSLEMLQTLIVSILVLTHTIQIWHILVLSFFLGMVVSFEIPIRHAFIIQMIENKDDLGNAIALNSSMFNAARLIGPSIGGIVISLIGEGACFVLNTLSYLAVIFSLLVMRITPKVNGVSKNHIWDDLKEGFIYAFRFIPIRYILLLSGLVSFMTAPSQVLMPVFAKEVFHGGPKTLGFLLSMPAVGALIASIYLAGRKSVLGLVKMIGVASVFFGIGIAFFSLSTILWFSMMILGLVGFAVMVQMAASNTILQTIVDEDKRGRIMSLYTVSFLGMAPLGSLFAGGLANKIGAPYALLLCGVLCFLGAVIFLKNLPRLREKIRPVYIEKGILPPIR